MTPFSKFLLVLIIVIILWGISVPTIAIIAYRAMFKPHFKSSEYTREECLKNGEFEAALLSRPWESVFVRSPRGYDLATFALAAEGTAVGTAVFVHGITWSHYGMMKYLSRFAERGWNVVSFDLPGHGDSPASGFPQPSYGYFEKFDTAAVVDWARARFPNAGPVVLVGESLGAGTVLQCAPVVAPIGGPHRVDAVIADCAFSSASDELEARLAADYVPRFVRFAAIPLISAAVQRLRGFRFEDASSSRAVLESDVPILFIHGSEDTYVPTAMSVSMAEARKKAGIGSTELLIVEGALHARSVLVNSELWFLTVFAFIDRYARDYKNG